MRQKQYKVKVFDRISQDIFNFTEILEKVWSISLIEFI
jgi:hypothetical protein